jgi:hypothetical protein
MNLCSVYNNIEIITKVETDYDVFCLWQPIIYRTVKSCLKDNNKGNQNIPWQLAHVLGGGLKKKRKGQMM